jgi:hypothetical protein
LFFFGSNQSQFTKQHPIRDYCLERKENTFQIIIEIKALKNILLDQHLTYFNQDEFSHLLKDYDKILAVGTDIKATSFDENCANFCLERNCDFLTTDKKSYGHFFKIKKIKSVEIFQFMKKEPKIDRPVFIMRIKTE